MPARLLEAIHLQSIRRRGAMLNAAAKNAREALAAIRARSEQRIIDGERRRTEAAFVKAREAARSNEHG